MAALSQTDALALACQRLITELEWCDQVVGPGRLVPRLDTLAAAKAAVRDYQAANAACGVCDHDGRCTGRCDPN